MSHIFHLPLLGGAGLTGKRDAEKELLALVGIVGTGVALIVDLL